MDPADDRSAPAERPSFADAVAAGACFGLVTGLLESALLVLEPFPITEANLASTHHVWTVPTTYAVGFAGFAAFLAVLAAGIRRVRGGPWIVGGLAFAGTMLLLLLTPQLHRLAKLALSAGIAVQLGRTAGLRPGLFHAARKAVPVLAALVVLLGLVTALVPAAQERWRAARLPPAEGDAPNVVLLILDTVRAQSLGLYGRGRPTTPRIEALAREGVTFEIPVAPSPWTLPTHATLFTGRQPREHGADWTVPLDGRFPTLAEVFTSRGYRTGGFVANLYYVTKRTGVARGFLRYEEHRLSPGQWVLDTSVGRRLQKSGSFRRWIGSFDDWNRKTAADVNGALLRWIDEGPGSGRPFFAFLNYFDAHEPYLPPDPWRTMFGPDTVRKLEMIEHSGWLGTGVRQEKESMSSEEVQGELDAYEAAIAYMDEQIGILMDELAARGLLERTLFVLTSDHGEQFGEHGHFDHGNSLYAQALHVPLVMSFPDVVPRGRRVGAPIPLSDVPATLLDLVGIQDRDGIPGRSLARYWTGSTSPDEAPIPSVLTLSESRDETIRSVVSDGYHYLESDDGPLGLYDLLDDREERVDLLRSEGYEDVVERLRGAMASAAPGGGS